MLSFTLYLYSYLLADLELGGHADLSHAVAVVIPRELLELHVRQECMYEYLNSYRTRTVPSINTHQSAHKRQHPEAHNTNLLLQVSYSSCGVRFDVSDALQVCGNQRRGAAHKRPCRSERIANGSIEIQLPPLHVEVALASSKFTHSINLAYLLYSAARRSCSMRESRMASA